MKNKRKNLIIGIFVILIIVVCVIIILKMHKKDKEQNLVEKFNETNTLINEIVTENNELTEEEKNKIEEIKNETGINGNTNLYEVQKDNTNNEIAIVKPSIKYKVAFAGMIKNAKPKISELDKIINENHPKYAGIWVNEKDRNTILKSLTNSTMSQYYIDQNGYLKIENKDEQDENDKKLEKAINGNKLYIISISSTCYIVDDVTGEILDYSFEDMDKYQTYEYFEDNDKMIVFVTENKNNQLNKNSIITSVINLLG